MWEFEACLCKLTGEGQVTYEDFIDGILRCKGPARAIDQTLGLTEGQTCFRERLLSLILKN